MSFSKQQLNAAIETLYCQYYQRFYSSVDTMPKLCTYKLFKNCIGFEKYLSCVKNDSHRIALTRLRCSSHRLAIEEGRFRNIPRENRKCIFCNMNVVEDEYHFVLVCQHYREIRNKCLPKYYCHWPTLQKFRMLLSTQQSNVLNKLAKYIFLATKLRSSEIS